ncbi:MAG: prepilin-type N-terminal cleavage/methylation domain-containing protein [Candidatus Zixiibacteriota bacterium]
MRAINVDHSHRAPIQAWSFGRRRARGHGFTFMEIITVISLVAIIATIGGPPVNSFMTGSKLSAEAKILVSDIRLARYEAIRTQQVHRLELQNLATNTYACKVFHPVVESDPDLMDMTDDTNWGTILDAEVRELNPEFIVTHTGPPIIYFRPDGIAVSNWSPGYSGNPILPASISVALEDTATLTIFLTSGGVMTSEMYYEEY